MTSPLEDPTHWAPTVPLWEEPGAVCQCPTGQGHVCVADWMYPEFWEKCRKQTE